MLEENEARGKIKADESVEEGRREREGPSQVSVNLAPTLSASVSV